MRIAIVNDLPLAVEVTRRLIRSVPGYELAWTAANGAEAVEMCAKDRPDLILMDLLMPVMDGVQATASIMERSPCAVLIVTASVTSNTTKVFEAIGHGALDVVATPVWGSNGAVLGGQEFLRKVAVVGRLISAGASVQERGVGPASAPNGSCPAMVALGASTGGPKALAAVLKELPRGINAAVTVVQHLDVRFSAGLAQWLGEQTEMEVSVAGDGMKPQAGKVLVAGTNDHLVLGCDRAFHYVAEPIDYPYRPSVDELFLSLARNWKKPGLAAVMTGMGRDGARGLLELKRAGWRTIAQDEKTSAVYGMPRAAVELGAADEIVSLPDIAGTIRGHVAQGGSHER